MSNDVAKCIATVDPQQDIFVALPRWIRVNCGLQCHGRIL